MGFFDVFPFFVEMKVLRFEGVAAFLVPVSDEGFGFELTVEVGGLFDDEVAIHKLQ